MKKLIKKQSQITAIASALFLIAGIVAHGKAGDVAKHAKQLNATITSLANRNQRQAKELASLKKWLDQSSTSHVLSLQKTAPRIVQHMESSALLDHVHVNHLTMGKRSTNGTTDVSSFVQNSRFPGINSVHVHAYGSWDTLAGLNHWIDSIRKGPVAVTSLMVRQGHYDIRLRILGK